MNEPWKLMVVSHTHWDREWYLPFQVFRLRLVGTVDNLLRLLAQAPGYRYFLLDGQTIILDDVAEVAPAMAEALGEQMRAGRVFAGPWYVLPDEFLVSAESLVRNLLLGAEVAARYGPIMKIGYQPDAFGHIAQLPQILRGFGIDSAVIWRGVSGDVQSTEFRWRAPDGSEVLTVYLPFSYSNAAALPVEPEHLLARLQVIRQHLEPWASTRYLLLMNGGDHVSPQADLPTVIERANALLPDAQMVHSNIVEYVEAVRRAKQEGRSRPWPLVQGELRSGERAHLLPGVLSARTWIKQRNATCERLLEDWAEPFTVWTRLATGEPPLPAAEAILRRAWHDLLLNHPHDSICGCGVDQVHDEMHHRFDWVSQVAAEIVEASLNAITSKVGTRPAQAPASAGEPMPIVVFNPIAGPRADFVSVSVPAPAEAADYALADAQGHLLPYQLLGQRQTDIWSSTLSRSELLSFLSLVGGGIADWDKEKILGLEGMLVAILGDRAPQAVISHVDVRPGPRGVVSVEVSIAKYGEHNFEAIAAGLREVGLLADRGDVETFRLRVRRLDEVEIGLVSRDVPSFGYSTYYLLPGHRPALQRSAPRAENFIENHFLSVQADPADGTLTLIDKETGAVFEGLNRFGDQADAGDEYNYSPPPQDLVVDQPTERPRITLVEDGPVRLVLRVDQVLALPRSLTDDRQARLAERVDCPFVTFITVYRDVRRVDVRTEVVNRARDHRLRVLFPTHMVTDRSHAGGHFAVTERPIALPQCTEDWLERPVGTHPMREFVAVQSGGVGLLVAARGLMEYEVLRGERGVSVALTLLRSVGWLSRDDLAVRKGHAGPGVATPEAQCLGPATFEYALVPFARTWETALPAAQSYTSPLRGLAAPLQNGPLPASQSFLEVSPAALAVSAIKRAHQGDGLIVRFYNLRPQPTAGTVKLFRHFRQAELVQLNEELTGQVLARNTDTVRLEVGAHKIATLYFHF